MFLIITSFTLAPESLTWVSVSASAFLQPKLQTLKDPRILRCSIAHFILAQISLIILLLPYAYPQLVIFISIKFLHMMRCPLSRQQVFAHLLWVEKKVAGSYCKATMYFYHMMRHQHTMITMQSIVLFELAKHEFFICSLKADITGNAWSTSGDTFGPW